MAQEQLIIFSEDLLPHQPFQRSSYFVLYSNLCNLIGSHSFSHSAGMGKAVRTNQSASSFSQSTCFRLSVQTSSSLMSSIKKRILGYYHRGALQSPGIDPGSHRWEVRVLSTIMSRFT